MLSVSDGGGGERWCAQGLRVEGMKLRRTGGGRTVLLFSS